MATKIMSREKLFKQALFSAMFCAVFSLFSAVGSLSAQGGPACFFYGELTGGITGTAGAPCNSSFQEQYAGLVSGGFDGFQPGKCYLILTRGSDEGAGEVDCATALIAVDSTGDATASDPPPFSAGGEGGEGLSGEDIFGTSREELQNCDGADCVNNNPITRMVIYAINFLSALIGIIVVGVIVSAGIQYSSSGGDPQKVAQAKKRIINAVIALIAYFFMFGIFQWLVPGGIFS